MQHALFIVWFFMLGACIGSFLNVVVWRVPRGESLMTPPSRCPTCLHRLAWYDNFPVFGWLWLRGRCRYCHSPISAQYPTVEFLTGVLFVLYYVMYFVVGQTGPCWVRENPPTFDGFTRPATMYFVTSIGEHWPQYTLAVFTISALLAASLIDAKLFWIPQSIPIVMGVVGLLYHTVMDRPLQPGALNVRVPAAGGMAVGAGVGLILSLALVRAGKMKRSFAEGWPELEVDQQGDAAAEEAKPGVIARAVGGWIQRYRGTLSDADLKVMAQQQAAADARERAEAARARAEAKAAAKAAGPKAAVKEFTPADIRREIRKEMVFLMPPLALGMLGALLVIKGWAPGWAQLLAQHDWLSGLLGSLLGGLVGGFVVWMTRILGSMAFGREAMGMGDVDLMFGVGTIVGAGASTVAFFVAPFFGLALAVYMLVIGKRRELPYGPYLSLGTAFVMIYYCPIAEYLRPGLAALSQVVMGTGTR